MHKKAHDNLNYAIHTKMLMLEEWRRTKTSIVTLTTSIFPILEALHHLTFWFHIYAIDYLDSCFDHFITLFSDLNRLTMGAKVEFVYNVLSFDCNYICVVHNKADEIRL